MAIARGAGTEIIRSIHADDIDATVTNLIVGIQHHIYTVLSIVFHAATWQASGNWVKCYIQGYDSKVGATDQSIIIFQQDMSVQETYVWNDKFSFNGAEPSGTNVLSAAEQILIAAQGGSADQELQFTMTDVADDYDIMVTYLDQDWS